MAENGATYISGQAPASCGNNFLDFLLDLLAGRMCTRQGVVWRPTELLAQQASVINSESDCGRYVTVLASPFD